MTALRARFRHVFAALAALALLAAGATDAQATHFRYGTLRWEKTAETTNTVTIEITHESAWRFSYPWPGFQTPTINVPLNVGVNLVIQRMNTPTSQLFSQPMMVIPSSINTGEDWFVGSNQVTVTLNRTDLPVRIFWDSNARISTLLDGNNDRPFRVESIMSAVPNAASPAASILPIITLARVPAAKFFIPAADIEGDFISWSISPLSRSLLVKAIPDGTDNNPVPPNFVLDPATGEVTWDTLQESTGLYAVQFLVTDIKGAETPVDALLRVVPNAGVAPEALVNGLPTQHVVSVRPNNLVSFPVTGVDLDPGSTVTLTSGALPPGATMTPSLPTAGAGAPPGTTSQFNWTPTLAQAGNVFLVSFAVTDNLGIQATNSAQIRVLENFAPAVTCPIPAVVEATGPSGATATISADVSDPDGDALTVRWFVDAALVQTDNVPAGTGATVTLTHSYSLAAHPVRIEVADHLLTRECSTSVTVVDTTPPVLTLPASQTIEATGPGGAVATWPPPTAFDIVDGNVPVVCSRNSGDLFPLGATTVTCTATDSHNNTGTGNFTITVVDTTAPVVTVPADMTLEATGPAGAPATVTATAFDLVDGNITPTCAPPSGSTFPLGTTTVTCTATDFHNNTGSASFTITVVDTTPPVVTVPANMTIEATGPGGAAATYTASAFDLVDGNITPTCAPPSGSTFPLGTTTVTCTATDAHNNTGSASFTVTVVDTTPPVVTVPANMTREATGPTGAVATFTASAFDIVDGNITPTCAPPSGSTFPLGTTTVTCTATDAHNNTGSASFTVTVVDTTPPVLTLPANMTVQATGPNGAMVTFSATAVDLVDGNVPVTCVPPSGSTFPLGTTTVNCSATDAHNNTATGSFTITVVDSTPPTVTVSLSPGLLWPPNHKMVKILVTAQTNEPGSTCSIFKVTSNEPVDGRGDGNTREFDWIIGPGPMDLQLRAERQGPGSSRIYTVTVRCVDAAGNAGFGTATAIVPHDMGGPGPGGRR